MVPKSGLKVSPAAKLIALAVVAVLLPTTVLSVLEYRSLLELQAKTMAAVKAMPLRQTVGRFLNIRYAVLMRLASKPNQEKFREGWINRILALKRKANEILDR